MTNRVYDEGPAPLSTTVNTGHPQRLDNVGPITRMRTDFDMHEWEPNGTPGAVYWGPARPMRVTSASVGVFLEDGSPEPDTFEMLLVLRRAVLGTVSPAQTIARVDNLEVNTFNTQVFPNPDYPGLADYPRVPMVDPRVNSYYWQVRIDCSPAINVVLNTDFTAKPLPASTPLARAFTGNN